MKYLTRSQRKIPDGHFKLPRLWWSANSTRQDGQMREWLGFETAEICARLRASTENCRTLLHRARTALRVCMQAHNPGTPATP